MDGWVGHVGWPIADGLTARSSSLAQDRESSPAETSILTTMLRRQGYVVIGCRSVLNHAHIDQSRRGNIKITYLLMLPAPPQKHSPSENKNKSHNDVAFEHKGDEWWVEWGDMESEWVSEWVALECRLLKWCLSRSCRFSRKKIASEYYAPYHDRVS